MHENEYTDLIQGFHKGKPLFTEWIYTLTEPLREARKRLANMPQQFDVDTAEGRQLDAVGVRVGVSRGLPSIIADVYFAFDDVNGYGFDRGLWQRKYDATEGISTMDDDTYRAVVKSKVFMNHWDGSNEGLIGFMRGLCESFRLPPDTILVRDGLDMTVEINIRAELVAPVLRTLIERRIIDFVAAGVGSTYRDYKPLFGFDRYNTRTQGFEAGYWEKTKKQG